MSQKITTTILAIVSILILSGLGYWIFFGRGGEPVETQNDDDFFLLSDGGGEFAPLGTDDTSGGNVSAPAEQFAQITKEPVVGFTTYTKSIQTGTSTTSVSKESVVRYVLKANGHIYDYNLETGSRERVSNITIPQGYRAVWKDDASAVFVQNLSGEGETVRTYVVDLQSDGSATTSQPTVEQLPANIVDISVRGDQFAVVRMLGNSAVIEVGDMASRNLKEVYRSGFKEWLLDWVDTDTLLLTTKPSGTTEGYAYLMSSKGGELRPFLRNVAGLITKVTPSGDRVVYSRSTNTSVGLFTKALDSEDSVTNQLARTLPEKCTTSILDKSILYCGVPAGLESSTYPDEWYKGKTAFIDRIQKMNVDVFASAETIYDPRSALGLNVDLIDPLVTEDDKYFVAQDKLTNTLWRLRL